MKGRAVFLNKVTIYDIAEQLNISTATVNRALNNKSQVSEKTRQRVLKKAEELGYSGNRAARSLARRMLQLDLIIYNRVPAFHNDVIAGARQALEELQDFNVHGHIYEIKGTEYSAHQQILETMQQLVDEKHQGLLLLGTFDTTGYREAISRYCREDYAVAIINGELPDSQRLFAVRQDDEQAGRMAAELLYRFCSTGPVAAFTGRPDSLGHRESIRGFCAECESRGLQVAAVYENHDDPEFAAYNTARLFREHPEVRGLYVNSANSVSVCQKLEELGLQGKVQVVTSDVFEELRDFMRRDVIQATIFQDPYQQGYLAVQQMYRCLAEGEPSPDVIYIRPTVVLQSNV